MAAILLNTNIPELEGSDTALCLSNLEALWARGDRVGESVLAMLAELAEAILRDADGDPDTVDSILLSLLALDTTTDGPPHERMLDAVGADGPAAVNGQDLHATAAYYGLTTRLRLYRFLTEKAAEESQHDRAGEAMPPTNPNDSDASSFGDPPSSVTTAARGRIAYMAGAFADKAYARFASCVPRARAAACHSFREACEEVHAGHCEYAILPQVTRQNGRLVSFSRLMLRYGLVSVAATDLEDGAAEEQTMRFALLRRGEDEHFPAPATENATHLEILHAMSAPSFPELLMAADYCGLAFCRADTLPPDDDADLPAESRQDTPRVLCVLATAGADFSTFRRYLRLEAPEDIVTGHYAII